jgi:hypothetical protein
VTQAPPQALHQESAGDGAGALALNRLIDAGFRRIEPPILQPASVFLDMSGEDIRGRLYLTSDADGAELCLRPDYTIPVCLAYLASAQSGREAQYSYLGPVFRARPGQSGESTQSGLESYGRNDADAADAEIFAVAMESAQIAGAGALDVRLGDAHLFDRVLHALDLPEVWLRRLRRGLAQGRALETILTENGNGSGGQSGVLAAPRPWSKISWRSPASPGLADAARARSPIAFSIRRPFGRASACRRKRGLFCNAFLPSAATRMQPRTSCATSPPTRVSTSARRSILSISALDFWRRAA